MSGLTKFCYIAGPMTGIPLFNFPAFDEARDFLNRASEYRAVSPADMDRELGFDPTTLLKDWDWNVIPATTGGLNAIIDRCYTAVMQCDAIFLLPGWEKSKGALAELAIAKWRGLKILGDGQPAAEYNVHIDNAFSEASYLRHSTVKPDVSVKDGSSTEDILDIAKAITSGDRQHAYGPPDQDFRRTADMWTALFGHMLREGVAFETWNVAQAMVLLKLSRLQHSRKRDNVIDAAGYSRCMDICYRAGGGYQS